MSSGFLPAGIEPSAICAGSAEAKKIYLGSTKLWENGGENEIFYLTDFEQKSSGIFKALIGNDSTESAAYLGQTTLETTTGFTTGFGIFDTKNATAENNLFLTIDLTKIKSFSIDFFMVKGGNFSSSYNSIGNSSFGEIGIQNSNFSPGAYSAMLGNGFSKNGFSWETFNDFYLYQYAQYIRKNSLFGTMHHIAQTFNVEDGKMVTRQYFDGEIGCKGTSNSLTEIPLSFPFQMIGNKGYNARINVGHLCFHNGDLSQNSKTTFPIPTEHY